MSLRVGDICISVPGVGDDAMVVTEVSQRDGKSACTVISLSKKRLLGVFCDSLIKIGELSPEMTLDGLIAALAARPPIPGTDSPDFLEGKRRAEKEAAYEGNEYRLQWKRLAEAHPGELLALHTARGAHEVVTFHHVLPRGEKYVFVAATRKGKIYRYPVEALVVQP